MPRITIASAVKDILLKSGKDYIWFGHMDTWNDAHELACGSGAHPKDAWQSVRKALSSSKLFKQQGYIKAASWSGREVLHPRFVLVTDGLTTDGSESGGV